MSWKFLPDLIAACFLIYLIAKLINIKVKQGRYDRKTIKDIIGITIAAIIMHILLTY
jgi:predicted transcriptional regulator